MASATIPSSERTVYKRNPIVEVIAQVRFPDLLKLQESVPVEFQEAIRSHFPLFKQRVEAVASDRSSRRAQIPIYDFLTQDELTSISLARNFIAIKTSTYHQWCDFRASLERALQALEGIYKPSFFTRLGLRYVDIIDREALGIQARPWSDLIRPAVCGLLADKQFSQAVKDMTTGAEIAVSEEIKARLQAGTITDEDSRRVAFLIDADIFTDARQEASGKPTLDRFDYFNEQAGNLFRWCIQPPLEQALGKE